MHATAKPDIDNLAKAALDAVGEFDDLPPLIWADDSQVTRLIASKRYAGFEESPGLLMAVIA